MAALNPRCCHRGVEGVAAPLLAIPFREVGRMAGEAFARKGHRRVALFAVHRAKTTGAIEEGLREGLRTAGGVLDDRFTFCGKSTSPNVKDHEQAVMQALKRLLAHPGRPTAIYATFDSIAELIYLLLCKLGVRVPEDISLVGFGGTCRQGAILGRLTSVAMDEGEVGRRAVTLLEKMGRGEIPLQYNEETSIPLVWAEGETLDGRRDSSR